MGEFADKYNGDIQACLRGLQSERMGGTEFEIDRDTRKRKWAAAQEGVEASGSGPGQGQADQARAAKNGELSPALTCCAAQHHPARTMTATPKKPVAGPSNTSRTAAVNRTPGAFRTTTTRPSVPKPSPAPQRPNKPPPFVPTRTSPTKQPYPRTRPPSSATFNPTMLPAKAPTYPTLRAPRRDESMLSVNGSPLANPYALGLGWFTGEDIEEAESHLQGKGKGKQTDAQASKTLRRVNSIVIRRDPSVSLASSSSSSSQSQHQTNGTLSQAHSRENSQTQPTARSRSSSRTQPPSYDVASQPSNNIPAALAPSGSASALVSIPTKDGHLLEFDPLTTSPRALDKLLGITDSAKKQAKEEMARLVKEAVRKWVIE